MIRYEEIETIDASEIVTDKYGNQVVKKVSKLVPITLTDERFARFETSGKDAFENTISFKVERELMAELFIYNGVQYIVTASNQIDELFDYVTAKQHQSEKRFQNESN